jgi:hypothetical protein
MIDDGFHSLLQRTARFREAVHSHVAGLAPAHGTRPAVAFQAGLLSLEHATGALVLIEAGLFLPTH